MDDKEKVVAWVEKFLRDIETSSQEEQEKETPTLSPDDLPDSLSEALIMTRMIEEENGDFCNRFHNLCGKLLDMQQSAALAYKKSHNPKHKTVVHVLGESVQLLIDHHQMFHILTEGARIALNIPDGDEEDGEE